MKSATPSKRSLSMVKKRIDDNNEYYPLLDYSFHDAEYIEQAVAAVPRVAPGAPALIKEGYRYHSYGLNLHHNRLNGSLYTLPNIVKLIFINPNALSFIDLSFNAFTEIPSAIAQFPSLTHLYFHKNLLSNIKEVQKLVPLKELTHLTLHRNPIEDDVPYLRFYVLSLLPNLKTLNRAFVSRGDHRTSIIWEQMHKHITEKLSKKETSHY